MVTFVPEQPLAYFLTFRCYGTWLHGDTRGSTAWSTEGAQFSIDRDSRVERFSRERLLGSPVTLTPPQRKCVETSIIETCSAIGWCLRAQNVRTNHVHLVLSGEGSAERMLVSLKAWSTRRLKTEGLIQAHVRPWSRHGSTAYLWDEKAVEDAIAYVLHGQDVKG
jgi:REP element-mobilizing transposase RayT